MNNQFGVLAVPKSGEIFTFEKSKKSAQIARNNIKVRNLNMHKTKLRVLNNIQRKKKLVCLLINLKFWIEKAR